MHRRSAVMAAALLSPVWFAVGCGKDEGKPEPQAPSSREGKEATRKGQDENTPTPGHNHRREIVLTLAENVRMKFVRIPPGEFWMGSPESEAGRDDDEKRRRVKLTKGFWMQTTEVTQAQWKAVMGRNPSRFGGDPNRPVERVSWNDCMRFVKRLNARFQAGLGEKRADLPTEAEWEYACRAGSTGKWCFGDDESKLGDYAWYRGNSVEETHPAGAKKANAWGLHDMHGNQWEWCKDWYGPYSAGDASDPKGPATGKERVLRGGSWRYEPKLTRSAVRFRTEPGIRGNHDIGLRVALR